MTTLVVGGSGATGRKLVDQLLSSNQTVKVIVRTSEKLPEAWKKNEQLFIIHASVLDIGLEKMAEHLKDCHAVVSCLGHNMSWKGIYGAPDLNEPQGRDRHGNPNTLTHDRRTSSLTQSTAAHSTRIELRRFDDELPPITVHQQPPFSSGAD